MPVWTPIGDRLEGAVGLAFGWLQPTCDADAAARQLGAALHAVADLPGEQAALDAVTASIATADDNRLAELMAEQTVLRDRVGRARDELNMMARGDDDALAP